MSAIVDVRSAVGVGRQRSAAPARREARVATRPIALAPRLSCLQERRIVAILIATPIVGTWVALCGCHVVTVCNALQALLCSPVTLTAAQLGQW